MDYITIVIATVVFFLSFGFFVMAWSKKPTKRYELEMKEAGEEIAKQIQEATEESLVLIEKKIVEMEKKYQKLEERYEANMKSQREREIKEAEEAVLNKVKEQKENPLFALSQKDENLYRIHQLHKQGCSMADIAKEMGMNVGVIQVYLNLLKMNKIS